jgi:hypothetical protein
MQIWQMTSMAKGILAALVCRRAGFPDLAKS